jgi:FkbM family methyltransferase
MQMAEFYDVAKQSDLIFDVGMHKGEDSEFYLKKGFRVVAFEADPDLAQYCRERFRGFIDMKQLVIVEGAIVGRDVIGAGQKKVRFYRNGLSVWGTTSADWASRNMRLGYPSSAIEVDAVDFTQIIQRYGMPHFMKVDIEGTDMVCINALNLFRERPDYLSLESDKNSLAAIRFEIETLEGLGYDSFKAVEQSSITRNQVPPNPSKEGAYAAHRFMEGASGLFGLELGGEWKPRRRIILQYAVIRLGYYLVGDDGILNRLTFPGVRSLRLFFSSVLGLLTKAPVPGWYDTHARHSYARG